MRLSLNSFSLPPIGLHPVRIIGMAFVGSHLNTFTQKMQSKVLAEFELSTELRDDGLPHTMWKGMTASLHQQSKLRPLIEIALDRKLGPEELKGFDPSVILGAGL